MHGRLEARLTKPDGSVIVRVKDNLIVNAGFSFIAQSVGLSTGRPGVMSHIAVGTGTTAAAAANTALVTELARKAATFSHTAGTKVFQFEATFNAGEATGAITEAGVFNAASAGTMLDRVVFAVINKGADDTLTQRFTFTMS
ncbi:MAG: hypothetical protein IOB85_02300 [Methylobacterium sp.]|nr:hypothetical protein [Cupriavidus sp.]MCA3671462.1 hypothetical protein [Methylobacterium sp.]MCA3679758.1 hypothetical protein [Methylobacterium sp.]MCA3704611.1 hypothetical protein [Methylobacterium sp.]NBS67119.1 hypothetical protein [Betaproteobacteria bacterium]